MKVPISYNFPEFKVPSILKTALMKMYKDGKTTSLIYRTLLNGIFTDLNMLGNNNADSLLEKHRILVACRGKNLLSSYLYERSIN